MILYQLPKDKANHFVYGFIIFITASLFFSDFISLSIVIFVAIFKELYDKLSKKGNPELLDFLATIAPALILNIIWKTFIKVGKQPY